MSFISTPRSRQLRYWEQCAESAMTDWKFAIANGNRDAAEKAKQMYILCRKTINEIEGRMNDEQN